MTAQFREILTLKGKKYGMVTEPLDPLIVREFNGQKEGFPSGYPTLYPSCTACWRGYIGHWLIDDEVDIKALDVYQHIYSNYYGGGSSVFNQKI